MLTYRRFSLTFAALMLLLTSACGGGGGSSSGSGGNDKTGDGREHQVSVRVTGSGHANPEQQLVTEGERATIELVPDAGYRIHSASGCGGTLDGNRFVTGPIMAACEITAEFIYKGGVSGQLMPAPDTAVDHTINDRRMVLGENVRCEDAQPIDKRATLHGFASASPTGGNPEEEHFAEATNPSDYYRVTLSAGQVVELEVADHQAGENNLELYLWNRDCSRKQDSATGDSSAKRVTTLLGGDSVVEVRAQAGISNYVLRVTTAWGTSSYSADDLQTLSHELPKFVPYQVILEFTEDAGDAPHLALSQALEQAEGLQLTYPRAPNPTMLGDISIPGGLSLQLPGVLEDLRLQDPAAFDIINTLRIIDFLAQQPGVRYAEPNYLQWTQASPNDSEYKNQWHYEKIDLPQAWDTTTGASSQGDIIVAVADTGIYLNHVDLTDKLLTGWDFHDGDSNPDDTNDSGNGSWHGTHVAGTVAAHTNNSTGVAGVSWAAKIMPVRVLGSDGGTRYNVIQGVRYAAGMANDSGTTPSRSAHVINLSLGGGGHSDAEQNLYHEVRRKGIAIVAAAGNDNTDQAFYPAAYDGVLSVSATNCQDERASYSNYGPTISLAAPGGGATTCPLLASSGQVRSTVGSGSGSSRSSAYDWLAGTSMASPHVAGVVALMRAVHPGVTPSDLDNLLADGQLTDDLGNTGRDDNFGYGRINANKAVQAAVNLRDGNPGWSARVVAQPANLYLGQESEATLELRQEGEGEAPAVVDWQSQEHWLSATEVDVDQRGLGTYKVQINRENFTEEDYGDQQGELVFALEDNSEVRVRVHIQVGFASEAAPVYVMLLNPETDEPLYEVVARWTSAGELRYQVEGVAPGDYILLAGSDIDADKRVCVVGEICGAYPSLHERQVISITDAAVNDADFELDILSRFRPFAGDLSAEGIRRR